MTFRIELLYVEHHKVGNREEFLNIAVPDAAVCIDAHMYSLLLETLHQWHERLCLECRLTTAEGDTATLTEEGLLVHGHAHDILDVGLIALALCINGIGIGAIEATEVTSLQENYKTQARAVESTQGLV